MVSLVGYTNAGKSTLFNRLTGAGVLVRDQLFATLDPTLRRLELPNGSACVLADTVGFVRDLPHELVAAFQSTLEETRDARLLLHVIDVAIRPTICVPMTWKRSCARSALIICPSFRSITRLIYLASRHAWIGPIQVWSVVSGFLLLPVKALESLLGVIAEYLHQDVVRGTVQLGLDEGRLRALLYDTANVLDERVSGRWWLGTGCGAGSSEFDDLQAGRRICVS